MWVRVQLQSLKLQILGLLQARSPFLDIKATIECGLTLKRIRDMTRTYSQTLNLLWMWFLVDRQKFWSEWGKNLQSYMWVLNCEQEVALHFSKEKYITNGFLIHSQIYLSHFFIVYSLKSIVIVTECIGDHSYTNKRNNCLNWICVLNFYVYDEY